MRDAAAVLVHAGYSVRYRVIDFPDAQQRDLLAEAAETAVNQA